MAGALSTKKFTSFLYSAKITIANVTVMFPNFNWVFYRTKKLLIRVFLHPVHVYKGQIKLLRRFSKIGRPLCDSAFYL